MHTAEQAKELWCPMVRNSSCGPESRNRSDGVASVSFWCIAADCAMWRWKDGDVDRWADGTHHQLHTGNIAVGYCGLAGRP